MVAILSLIVAWVVFAISLALLGRVLAEERFRISAWRLAFALRDRLSYRSLQCICDDVCVGVGCDRADLRAAEY